MSLKGGVWGFENERRSVKRVSERDREREARERERTVVEGLRAKLESM